MVGIAEARFPEHTGAVRTLFQEYADSLGVDLSFQDFKVELDTLPGKYAAPHGRVLLAHDGPTVLGCVAVRPLQDSICEMKRLYVRPAGRGLGLGRQLASRICSVAGEAGYTNIRLDTLTGMTAARSLYRSLGFRPIPPYYRNPLPDAQFLELDLRTAELPEPQAG